MTTRPLLLSLLLMSVLLLPACERDEPNPDDTRQYLDDHPYTLDRRPNAPAPIPTLTVTPTEATVEAAGDVFTFTASGGKPPYKWKVANLAYGSIADDNGNPCTYTVLQVKRNTLWVKDSSGQVATATLCPPTP
jgi:hypothetical protein